MTFLHFVWYWRRYCVAEGMARHYDALLGRPLPRPGRYWWEACLPKGLRPERGA